MELFTIASGSSGNCLAAKTDCGTLLVDAGISCKRICEGLRSHEVDPAQLTGILITHEHTDHINGLPVFLRKYRIPVYTSAPTGQELLHRMPGTDDLIRPVEAGRSFELGGLNVLPFATSHDAAGSLGFTFDDGVCRASLATDLGYVSDPVADAIRGSDFALVETNYEEAWLLNGNYPYSLKQRILGDRGHLSNAAGAELACYLAKTGTKHLVLGHLSKENNSPAQAHKVVEQALTAAGAELGGDITLELAPRSECSPLWIVGRAVTA